KNCPGIPGSSAPRSSRTSVYGPTASFATTLSRADFGIDPLLQAQRDLGARACDRVHGRRRAGNRGDARDSVDHRRLADRVAVRTRTGALRRVDDEIAAATADEVDDRRADAFLGHAAHTLDVETRGLKGRRGPFGGNEPE